MPAWSTAAAAPSNLSEAVFKVHAESARMSPNPMLHGGTILASDGQPVRQAMAGIAGFGPKVKK